MTTDERDADDRQSDECRDDELADEHRDDIDRLFGSLPTVRVSRLPDEE